MMAMEPGLVFDSISYSCLHLLRVWSLHKNTGQSFCPNCIEPFIYLKLFTQHFLLKSQQIGTLFQKIRNNLFSQGL